MEMYSAALSCLVLSPALLCGRMYGSSGTQLRQQGGSLVSTRYASVCVHQSRGFKEHGHWLLHDERIAKERKKKKRKHKRTFVAAEARTACREIYGFFCILANRPLSIRFGERGRHARQDEHSDADFYEHEAAVGGPLPAEISWGLSRRGAGRRGTDDGEEEGRGQSGVFVVYLLVAIWGK